MTGAVAAPGFPDTHATQGRLDEALASLAACDEVPDDARAFAEELCERLLGLGRESWPDVDPLLFAELMQAAGAVEHALRTASGEELAARLEVELESMRDVFADIEHGVAADAGRPAGEIARWLKETLGASNDDLRELLGPSTKTWERWLNGVTEPRGDDAARIQIAAQVVDQLRHALTPRGVLQWFDRPHPALGGEPPKALLRRELDAPRLVGLAAQMRRSDAA